MIRYYILDDAGEPVQVADSVTWSKWYETANRRVAREWVGDAEVSTVFLGLDDGFVSWPELIWESIVFGGPLDGYMDRCGGKRAEAMAMHKRMVEHVTIEHALEVCP